VASNIRDYAKGASIVAAVLHFEVGAGTLVRSVEDRGGLQFGVGEDIGDEDWTSGVGPRTSVIRREPRERNKAGLGCPSSAVRGLRSEQNHFSKAMLVRVSDYGTYAWEHGDLFRSTLRVATGDYNLGMGIFPMNAADGGTSVLVSSSGYGAAVEDNDSGLGGLPSAFHASLLELTLDGGPVRLGSAAAEIYHVESCHSLF